MQSPNFGPSRVLYIQFLKTSKINKCFQIRSWLITYIALRRSGQAKTTYIAAHVCICYTHHRIGIHKQSASI